MRIDAPVRSGQNRLERGREMRAGEVVLRAGEILNAPKIGLLAALGQVRPRVIPRADVGIVSTGDELVEPDQVPGPGQIRNSNAALLEALCQEAGITPTVRPIARDEADSLRSELAEGLKADVLLITGGVSAGARDLVPGVLAELDVTTVFHKVRLKPGKPLLFGIGPARRAASWNARLRAARQPGKRPGRLSPVRVARAADFARTAPGASWRSAPVRTGRGLVVSR